MTVTYDAFSLKRLQIFVYFFKNNGLDKQPGSSFFARLTVFVTWLEFLTVVQISNSSRARKAKTSTRRWPILFIAMDAF